MNKEPESQKSFEINNPKSQAHYVPTTNIPTMIAPRSWSGAGTNKASQGLLAPLIPATNPAKQQIKSRSPHQNRRNIVGTVFRYIIPENSFRLLEKSLVLALENSSFRILKFGAEPPLSWSFSSIRWLPNRITS